MSKKSVFHQKKHRDKRLIQHTKRMLGEKRVEDEARIDENVSVILWDVKQAIFQFPFLKRLAILFFRKRFDKIIEELL